MGARPKAPIAGGSSGILSLACGHKGNRNPPFHSCTKQLNLIFFLHNYLIMPISKTKDSGQQESANKVVHDFKASFHGELVEPGDATYDESRKVYNAMIDKQPGMIAYCTDVADVMKAVQFARDFNMEIAIRSGGHNGAGLCMCNGGLCIDLSRMKDISVDAEAKTVTVAAGCNWGEVDQATHAYGLATPSGIISTTGVAGLTLGGGHGHLSRKYGLTIDNLLEAEMVLADGQFVTVNDRENPDLFWAIRGGGGNFGIVTSFTFRLHPVTTVHAGPTFWEMEDAPMVMQWYRQFIVNAPEELNGFFAFLTVPTAPPYPEHLQGKKVCGIVWCYCGPDEQAQEVLKPVEAVGTPLLHHVGQMPYPAIQGAFDELYPKGDNWYWRGDFIKDLPDEAIEKHLRFGKAMPSMQSTMHLYPIDGAVHRIGRNETAFSFREANWSQVIVGVDHDPANNTRITDWTKQYWEAIHPYSLGGAYVNFMMEEGPDRVKATYRDNYERLARIKAKYDPTNLFHVNQNIQPQA